MQLKKVCLYCTVETIDDVDPRMHAQQLDFGKWSMKQDAWRQFLGYSVQRKRRMQV